MDDIPQEQDGEEDILITESEIMPLKNKRWPGGKRTPAEIARDRVIISELYVKGHTLKQIADTINSKYPVERQISTRQIGYEVEDMVKTWRADAAREVGDRVAEQLARIDRLEREYWAAWERSLNVKESITMEVTEGREPDEDMEEKDRQLLKSLRGKKSRVMTKREQGDGDTRFLDGVQWCIEQRSKILGLYAPEWHGVIKFGELSNDELIEYIQSGLAEINAQKIGVGTSAPESGNRAG